MENKRARALLSIAKQFKGNPVYIFNRDMLIRNFIELQDSFRNIYLNTYIAYSYKTNYTPAVCKTINNLGGYAEIVSQMEFNMALHALDVNPERIIYNGVLDESQHKANIMSRGGIVNADSLGQLEKILNARYRGATTKIGLRIALDKNGCSDSRFGMTRDEVEEAVKMIQEAKGCVSGIHCHVGGSRSLASWENRAKTMIGIANYIESLTGEKLEYIDLGGHLYGNMDPELKQQFGDVPSFLDYAKVVGGLFFNAYGDDGPKLILEPGTALVADAVSILGSVSDVKRRGQKDIVTLNVSSYDCGMIADYKNLTIENLTRDDKEEKQEYVVHGYTCMEQDYINRSYVGKLESGDLVHILNTGAYSNTMKAQFILPGIAMVMVDDNYQVLGKAKDAGEVKKCYSDYYLGV